MVGLFALAVLAFAAYRGTQLVVHDSLLDPLRDRLTTWHANRPESRTRSALVTLSACTYCAGWWVSGAFLAAYLVATGQWPTHWTLELALVHGIEWFAVAGGQALLNRWDDTRDGSAQ